MIKMKTVRYILVPAVAALLISFSASAQESEALAFGRVSHDPVSAAMGGAGVASSTNMAYASYRNAAAVPYYERTLDVAAGYQLWQASNTNNLSLAGAWNVNDKFGLTAGFTYGMCAAYDIYDAGGTVTGTFAPSEMQANLGFGWRFMPWLSLGANVRYLSNTLSEGHSYGAVSSDIFLMSRIRSLTLALGVSSLGSRVESASGAMYSLPASLTFGAGYLAEFAETHRVEVLLDADWYFAGALSAAVGAEYNWNRMVSVRAGYRYGGESVIPSYASVGAGVEFIGISLDLAYLIAIGDSPMKNTLTFGLGYSF